jgi:hypothetical protein
MYKAYSTFLKVRFLVTIILLCGQTVFGQPDSTLYSFFVAGHTYGNAGSNNIGFHPPFKNKFGYIQNRAEIEFGVLTGDIVSANPVAQDWDEIDADIETLGLPVYFAVGNHDMENRPLFESRYGFTYYNFFHNDDLFIVLDPNIDGWSITGDQLQYLQNVVNDNYLSTENIFVFFHQVLWVSASNEFNYIKWNSDAGRLNPINFWSSVVPIFDSIPNDVFMFAGDVGVSWASDVSYDKFNNITLISSGMGDPDGENFIVVNVDSSKSVDYDLICLSDPEPNCLGELTDYLTIDSLTNIKESFYLNLYPNPTSHYLNISASVYWTLELFNVQGTLVFKEKSDSLINQKIDVSYLPKGFYIAKFISSKGQSTPKILIE